MNIKMELSYITPRGTETTFISDEMSVKKALLLAEDIERTGRLKKLTFVDSHDQTWRLKELKKYTLEIQTEPSAVTVYFDGGFDLQSRTSGLGCVIYYEQNKQRHRLRINTVVNGLDTNNEAEYAALHLGVQELKSIGVHHLGVTFIGDSMVVINQLNEEWACYEAQLAKWMDRIEGQLNTLGIIPKYELVPRILNKEADQLATQALKGIEIMSTKEVE